MNLPWRSDSSTTAAQTATNKDVALPADLPGRGQPGLFGHRHQAVGQPSHDWLRSEPVTGCLAVEDRGRTRGALYPRPSMRQPGRSANQSPRLSAAGGTRVVFETP